MRWEDAAAYCETTFGIFVDWEERFFHCPECGEPLYEDDWGLDSTDGWAMCPICEVYFEDID